MSKLQTRARGVEVRGDAIRVRFSWRGREFRETIRLPPTAANIRYAERLRGEVVNALERGTFDYYRCFPAGKNARHFGAASDGGQVCAARFDAFIARCLIARDRGNLSPSTYRMYEAVVRCQLMPEFGALRLDELTSARCKEWIEGQAVTAKTRRNRISVLRLILADAVDDGAIDVSPLARINMKRAVEGTATRSDWKPDPFNRNEVDAILSAAGPYAALFRFAFATGLRTSELVGLEWRDIDLNARTAHICRAVVVGTVKGPKTEAGDRVIDLSDEAVAALRCAGTVGGRVWISPTTRRPYAGDKPIRGAWRRVLSAASVRYRNPYQTRHTFASSLLSAGVNPWYVAGQMGHVDVTMIFRTYGRWLPDASSGTAQVLPRQFIAGLK